MQHQTQTIPIFHITAVDNLASIFNKGAIIAKNFQEQEGVNVSKDISYVDIQSIRAIKEVINPPGGVIHDYVPFYFAPRAPMLYGLSSRNIRQESIVHLFTTVDTITESAVPYVFYDMHMKIALAVCYNTVENLKNISWELFFDSPTLPNIGYNGSIPIPQYSKYWHDNIKFRKYANRKAARQAEFLVKNKLDISLLKGIGVISNNVRTAVSQIVKSYNLNLPVYTVPNWYYTS